MASLFPWFPTRNHLFSMTGCVCVGWVVPLVSFKILPLGIYTIFLAHSCAPISELGLLEFLEYVIHVFQKIREVFNHYFSKSPFSLLPPPFLFSFWILHDTCLWVWGCPTGPSGCLFAFALFPFVSQSVSAVLTWPSRLLPLLSSPAEPSAEWFQPQTSDVQSQLDFFYNSSWFVTIQYSSTYYSNFLSLCSLFCFL